MLEAGQKSLENMTVDLSDLKVSMGSKPRGVVDWLLGEEPWKLSLESGGMEA